MSNNYSWRERFLAGEEKGDIPMDDKSWAEDMQNIESALNREERDLSPDDRLSMASFLASAADQYACDGSSAARPITTSAPKAKVWPMALLSASALRYAAVLAVGVMLGAVAVSLTYRAAPPALTAADSDTRVRDFLERSQLFLLGVRSISDGCNYEDSQMLSDQKNSSIGLLVELRPLLEQTDCDAQTHRVLAEVEHALMTIAGLENISDADDIRTARCSADAAFATIEVNLKQ